MITKPVGIIGGGNFGMAIAKLISTKNKVILHSRRQEFVDDINQGKNYKTYPLNSNLSATAEIAELCQKCDVICLLYTSPSPRDRQKSRMPSSA